MFKAIPQGLGAITLASVLSLACGSTSSNESASSGSSLGPNIVLILADDLGYETLGAYGGTSYDTPNLNALAASGMRFDAAHANPLCTPSRVKLMTGRYNLRNYVQFEHLAAGETTFAHVLSEAGYHTMVAGKWQLAEAGGQTPEDAGFDEHRVWHLNGKGSRYEDPLLTTNGVATDHVGSYGPDLFAEYINDFMKEHRDEPFLVYYPMVIPHGPHVPPPGYDDGGSDQANFKLMVEYMDDIVGRITGTLDALGLREKTLILFLGDNGTHTSLVSYLEDDAIAGGKGLTTDAGTRVPFIASWPGEVPRGSSNNDIVDLSVVLPTLAEAAGAAGILTRPYRRGEHSRQVEGSRERSLWAHLRLLPAQQRECRSSFRRVRTQPAVQALRDGRIL